MRMRVFALFPIVLLVGCTELQPTPQPEKHDFRVFDTASGPLLVDSAQGKVWGMNPQKDIFLEIPVTSKLLVYDPKTGKLMPSDNAHPEAGVH